MFVNFLEFNKKILKNKTNILFVFIFFGKKNSKLLQSDIERNNVRSLE